MEAPLAVVSIVRRLEEAGFATWAVGGCVRDLLVGRPAVDWDLATRARPGDVRRIFRRTVPIGVEHGTVGVLAGDGTMYEVTTFRRDVDTDGRHAVVAFADRIEDDLARRDFTINAIAWHPLRDEILDPFGGRDDLARRVLRAVGDPLERFAEDHLRVLRALRFAGRFGLTIEPATWDAMRASAPSLRTLSAERVREELVKVLDADPAPSGVLRAYRECGALAVLYPEIDALPGDGDASSGALATVDVLRPGSPLLRLAAWLRPLPRAQAAAVLVRLRLSNAQTDDVAFKAGSPPLPAPDATPAEVRRWLSAVGSSRLAGVARLQLAEARSGASGRSPRAVVEGWRRARAVAASNPPLQVGDLALDGGDLIRMGLKPGPAFGRILETLLAWVLEDPGRNDPELLRQRALLVAGDAADG